MKTAGRLDPAPWTRAWERIDADFVGHLEEIQRFLRRPTVSASDDDMLAGAEHVAALIEGAGGSAEIVATAGHPAVLGRIEGDGPRLLRYGMYDVQPADEPGWSSPPFAAATAEVPRAGPSVVARGAANSKGALASFLLALASARRVSDLPAEIVLLVDGEEELGSPHLPEVMSARRDPRAPLPRRRPGPGGAGARPPGSLPRSRRRRPPEPTGNEKADRLTAQGRTTWIVRTPTTT